MNNDFLNSQLKNATITHLGTSVTVLFRTRDRLSSQTKASFSYQLSLPVQFIFQTSERTSIEWWINGKNFNPHGPANTKDDQHQHHELYLTQNGGEGRSGGPSCITHTYGKHYVETWRGLDSFFHRDDDGPSVIEIHYSSPEDTFDIKQREMVWYQKGRCYRKNSWAHQFDEEISESIEVSSALNVTRTTKIGHRQLQWFDQNDDLHRTDGPAKIDLFDVKEAERDKKKGAWKYDRWTDTWFIHGMQIASLDIITWARRNHIKMWNSPCYDKSVFREADGEFCFITDFVGAMK
jgi:hypothetical protein